MYSILPMLTSSQRNSTIQLIQKYKYENNKRGRYKDLLIDPVGAYAEQKNCHLVKVSIFLFQLSNMKNF